MNYGTFLKKIREERKLTQVQVANALNIPKSTLSDYERNIITPSLDRFFYIVTYYGISPVFSLFGEEVIVISNYSDLGKQKAMVLYHEEKNRELSRK